MFSFVGDTVLDPFSGSGTTLVAALQNNRKGVGIEIDKDYCALSVKRIEKALLEKGQTLESNVILVKASKKRR